MADLCVFADVTCLDGAWAFLSVCLKLLKKACEEERPGVAGVEMVRLPSMRRLALDGACEEDEALVERGLRSVAEVAEARGVRVEWTWSDEAAGEWAVDGPAGELPPAYFWRVTELGLQRRCATASCHGSTASTRSRSLAPSWHSEAARSHPAVQARAAWPRTAPRHRQGRQPLLFACGPRAVVALPPRAARGRPAASRGSSAK